MKKCLIVYDSYHHGNTEKIASAMAGASGAELCKASEVKDKNLSEYEIVGFGAGIDKGKHYSGLLNAVEGLSLSGKTVFAFSTSGRGGTGSHGALHKLLEKRGAVIAGDFGCKGFDTYGPLALIGGISKGHPNDKDLEDAKNFVLKMVK
ncbi:flavodoxin family protein [Caproiciproducens faecalis]|uniref:Flavodoxin n=1 Tax=Caproiciproducens faecalis TaxID=2820301 RepID=A0ABS7DJJ6_9FIRM|nr:flavodoxin family protein [Caproiciproducens faecalis]MBW7571474.1 flavodoxin [Caproiciproducens faecalis]